jgi:hypothetical protein
MIRSSGCQPWRLDQSGQGRRSRRPRPTYTTAKDTILAYAASRLAREWVVLPREVGNYLVAFKTVWSWTLTVHETKSERLSPVEKLKAYLRQYRFLQNHILEMSRERFERCAGFNHKTPAGHKEFVISKTQLKESLGFDKHTLRDLEKQGILVGEGGKTKRLDTKRCVRLENGAEVYDRVYVFRRDKLGDE